ncbi:MAG: PD-(D/E)XK nuclease domain-containing protein, partial [Lachnospiraceae bacterium]|nr:PD-(D/E)XK nuclease domain-containing protein [Lachnospiraceae bacterium]
KRIHQELTYRDLYKDVEHLWSVLFATGYLTQRKKRDKDEYGLVIPNLEIRQIFVDQIREWFQEEVRKDTPMLDAFCRAFLEADVSNIEKSFNQYLGRTISIRDTNVRKVKKENFYHGILLGLLSHREDWDIDSNAESGNGYSDILVEAEEDTGFVIEIKYSEEEKLDKGCKEALKQIEEKHYEEKLREDGMTTIRKYGIACNRKKCKVLLG